MSAVRTARAATASAVLAGMLIGGSQLVVGPFAQARPTPMVATAAVNVRSGPGTGNPVIGTVWPGQVVTSRGEASAGWVPVTYQGRPGWMSASYLRSAGASGTVALRSSSSRHTRGTPADLVGGPQLGGLATDGRPRR